MKTSNKIIDFRLRPPTKGFLGLSIFDKPRLETPLRAALRGGAKPAPSFLEGSMKLCLQEMKEIGITKAIVMGRQAAPKFGSVPNDDVAEIINENPDQFMAYGAVNPMDIKAAVKEVERVINKLGFKGIQLEPGWAEVPMMADDRRMYPIYEKCDELRVPVAIVSSAVAGPDVSYSHPASIHRVAVDFPGLNIIVVHGAWPFVAEMVGVCLAANNVWLQPDIYLNTLMPGSIHFVEAANTFLADRLLYASSYPVRPLKESLEDFLRLPFRDEVKEKALYTNATRLVG